MTHNDYKEKIAKEFDWEVIKEKVKINAEMYQEPNDTWDEIIGRCYLGSVFTLTPSGKTYAPWTTNVTEEEAGEDREWWEALEEVAEEHGLFIESEADDIFAAKIFTKEELGISEEEEDC